MRDGTNDREQTNQSTHDILAVTNNRWRIRARPRMGCFPIQPDSEQQTRGEAQNRNYLDGQIVDNLIADISQLGLPTIAVVRADIRA